MSKSFICAKLPAASWCAMTITGYWHVDVFRPAHYQTYEVWCRLSIVCLSCIKHDISYCQKVAL